MELLPKIKKLFPTRLLEKIFLLRKIEGPRRPFYWAAGVAHKTPLRCRPKPARAPLLFLNERGKGLCQDVSVAIKGVYHNFEGIVGHECIENLIETMLNILKTVDNQQVNE